MPDARDLIWAGTANRYGLQKCDAAKVKKHFDQLRAEHDLRPQRVLAEARKRTNPLHSAAGWHWNDDAAAAEKYRIQVASTAITSLKYAVITKLDGDETTAHIPAYVQRGGGKTAVRAHGEDYQSIDETMSDPLERSRLLMRLLHDLEHLDRQYAVLLQEFPEVRQRWQDLRSVIQSHVPS
jgi:hypothetical protein